MHGIGNRIKAYTLAWYDYPKSDGLTKEDKAQNKNAEKANEYEVCPLLCLSVFKEQLISVSIGVCKLFSCNSKPTYALLASKRRPIDLQ